jgi:hypothetical protein
MIQVGGRPRAHGQAGTWRGRRETWREEVGASRKGGKQSWNAHRGRHAGDWLGLGGRCVAGLSGCSRGRSRAGSEVEHGVDLNMDSRAGLIT